MKVFLDHCEDVCIAYIGGGSRGWAWSLMNDLAQEKRLSGEVRLYDIDREAAETNSVIGNRISALPQAVSAWHYRAVETLEGALQGADVVVISILPGTLDEMESDVHTPEAYGVYQSVGDTTGPGGILRSMRTVPVFAEFGRAIRRFCPEAWVINYTNPMAVCVRALYDAFPGIKAYGCCHEVFGTQKLLLRVLREETGETAFTREDIQVNVLGVNHFTWITSTRCGRFNVMDLYRRYISRHCEVETDVGDVNWADKPLALESSDLVKRDLFLRYGAIAAAGDRHLAEYCPGCWYLKDRGTVARWGFTLTPVRFRKQEYGERLARAGRLKDGSEPFALFRSGEEGVRQICALMGFERLVTNVNMPNRGQVANLPLGAVVETNVRFSEGAVTPLMAGNIPLGVLPLVTTSVCAQLAVVEAFHSGDLLPVFAAFCNDPLLHTLTLKDCRSLFAEMAENTATYLNTWRLEQLKAL